MTLVGAPPAMGDAPSHRKVAASPGIVPLLDKRSVCPVPRYVKNERDNAELVSNLECSEARPACLAHPARCLRGKNHRTRR
jgi:hypothetical protein